MSSMTIAVFIFVASGDSSTPNSTTFKLFMFDIDTRIDDVSYPYQHVPRRRNLPVTPVPPRAS